MRSWVEWSEQVEALVEGSNCGELEGAKRNRSCSSRSRYNSESGDVVETSSWDIRDLRRISTDTRNLLAPEFWTAAMKGSDLQVANSRVRKFQVVDKGNMGQQLATLEECQSRVWAGHRDGKLTSMERVNIWGIKWEREKREKRREGGGGGKLERGGESTALQKRSKDIAQKVLMDEGELRRSARVRSQPRCSPAMAFHKYTNKWKEKPKQSKRHKKGHSVNLIFVEGTSP
ncbi:hypothetical protein M5K25_001179 [Dendrobium thyrsiflorum]|uniref:Uncharacterized protein n=1 Tax=Dendrobium thyrsiflorum TaxID=117978 RepID=A0ABD0VWE6_DENTH